MFVSKLMRTLGERSLYFSFFSVVLCIFGISAPIYLMGGLSQSGRDAWGMALGEGCRPWMMNLDGASYWLRHFSLLWHKLLTGLGGQSLIKSKKAGAHAMSTGSAFFTRDQGGAVSLALPSQAAVLACPWPTGWASCMARPKFSTQICSAWPQNWRVYTYRDVCTVSAGPLSCAGRNAQG